MSVYLYARLCILYMSSPVGSQKKALDTLELDLEMVLMYMLGTEPWSLVRAVSCLNYWAFFSAL